MLDLFSIIAQSAAEEVFESTMGGARNRAHHILEEPGGRNLLLYFVITLKAKFLALNTATDLGSLSHARSRSHAPYSLQELLTQGPCTQPDVLKGTTSF